MSLRKQFLKSDDTCKVTFRLPKRQAGSVGSVFLVGDFNDWDGRATPMNHLKSGDFTVTLPLKSGRDYQFRYLLDGATWENDGEADQYVRSPISPEDNSVVKL